MANTSPALATPDMPFKITFSVAGCPLAGLLTTVYASLWKLSDAPTTFFLEDDRCLLLDAVTGVDTTRSMGTLSAGGTSTIVSSIGAI